MLKALLVLNSLLAVCAYQSFFEAVAYQRASPSEDCKDEVEQTCGKRDYLEGPVCMKCIKTHLQRIDAGLVKSQKCTSFELHHYCFYYGNHESEAVDAPDAIEPHSKNSSPSSQHAKQPSEDCKDEVEQTCGKRDYLEGPICMKCIKTHLARIDAGLVKSQKCTSYELHHYCFYYGNHESEAVDAPDAIEPHSKSVVSHAQLLSGQPTEDCKDEVEQTCGKRDYLEGPVCMKCIKTHLQRIDAGLVKSRKCTSYELHHYCFYYGNHESEAVDAPDAIEPHSKNSSPSSQHAKQPSEDCKDEVEQTCGKRDYLEGPICMKCIKTHLARIDAGLVKSQKCTSYELHHYCFYYGNHESEAVDAPDAIEPHSKSVVSHAQLLSGQPTEDCKDEVEQTCGKRDYLEGPVCMKCIKTHLQRIDAGLVKSRKCTSYELHHYCFYYGNHESEAVDAPDAIEPHSKNSSPSSQHAKQPSEDCKDEVEQTCGKRDYLEGPICMKCIKTHLQRIDAGLVKSQKCTSYELHHYCFYYGNHESEAVDAPDAIEPHSKNSSPSSQHAKQPSEDCKDEVEQTCGKRDYLEGPVCMKCIKTHLQRIDAGLVKSQKCTSYELHHYCFYYGNHESEAVDAPDAIEPHSSPLPSFNTATSVHSHLRKHHSRSSCRQMTNELCGDIRDDANQPGCLQCIQQHYKTDLMYKCHLRYLHHFCDDVDTNEFGG